MTAASPVQPSPNPDLSPKPPTDPQHAYWVLIALSLVLHEVLPHVDTWVRLIVSSS